MPGGLLNLIAYGNQNIILNGNPQKTFFKCTYSKYTNFGLQKFRIDFKGQRILHPTQPSTFKFKIPRHADLLLDTYLVLTLPNIWSPILPPANTSTHWRPYEFKWIENIGTQIIQEARFTVGGHLIQKFSGQYLYNMIERDFGEAKKKHFYEMTGSVSELNDPANCFNRNGKYPNAYYPGDPSEYPEGPEPSIRGRRIYIPLNMWFTLSSKMAFPLASLQYAELEIEIDLRPIKELFVIRDPSPSAQYVAGIKEVTHRGGVVGCSSVLSPDLTSYVQPSFNEELQKLYRFLHPPPSVSLDPADYPDTRSDWDADIHLMSTYAFLTSEEVKTFAARSQSYLIREVHEYKYQNISGARKIGIETTGMIANWMWFFQRTDIALRNAWSNYTNWPYINAPPQPLIAVMKENTQIPGLYWDGSAWTDGTSFNIPGPTPAPPPVPNSVLSPSNPPYSYNSDDARCITGYYNPENIKDIMTTWGLIMDGKYRENILDAGVLKYVEKYARTSGNSPSGVFCYSFGLSTDPFELQPTGAMNLNKFSRIEFELATILPPIDSSAQVLTICDGSGNTIGINKPVWYIYQYTFDLTLLEERYNVLRFENGTAGLVYTR